MHTLRLAYATQFLIAVIAIYVLWSQVGGQSHLDLMPWYVKLGLGAGAALAVVKATDAAVSQEHAWNGRTLKWFGILLVCCWDADWRATTAIFIWKTMATISREIIRRWEW